MPQNFKHKFWIPENLNIDNVISENEASFKEHKLSRAKLLYIIDTLIHVKANNWREQEENNSVFTPLSSSLLDIVVHNYSKHLKFLIESDIMDSDGSYIIGEKCTGFCFTERYQGQNLKQITECDYALFKGINKLKNHWEEEQKQNTWGYSYLTHWWKTGKLKIDVSAAIEWINNYLAFEIAKLNQSDITAVEKMKSLKKLKDKCEGWRIKVLEINIGGRRFHFSGEGHRFYNPISNLKRELRSFLTYDGQQLVSIDIKNSQPFFTLLLHNINFWESCLDKKSRFFNLFNKIGDKVNIYNIIMLLKHSETQSEKDFQVKKFIRIVKDGRLYEYIIANFKLLYKDRFDTRQKSKKEVLRMFFFDSRKQSCEFYEVCRWFEQHFETTHRLFTEIKLKDYTFLPILLQRIESFLVIDTICKKISLLDTSIPLFTIHDSIITTKGNEKIVKQIMEFEIESAIGYEPKFSVEELNPIECNEPVEWRSVIGYEGFYEISNEGEVRGVKRMVVTPQGLRTILGKTLKTRINNDGYVDVRISKEGQVRTTFIHVLLAKAFIPNPKNKPEVNHINGIKTDNRIENLEWVSHAENIDHAYQNGLCKKKCIMIQDKTSSKIYQSIKDAATNTSIPYSSLKNMLSGRRTNSSNLVYTS